MKASLKFREDQKPLFRAKVPLSILGLPFQSGILAGESKELTLNLGTFFESGPSIKVAYRPNDAWNPFSLVVKTGIGPYGSPISSSMLMSAEFNVLGRGNPSFMLHLKPQFGDFSIKKLQSSVFERKARGQNGAVSGDDAGIEAVVAPPLVNSGFFGENGAFSGKKIAALPLEPVARGAVSEMLSGVEVAARTSLPVKGRAVVSFRWGVRVPAEMKTSSFNQTDGIAFQKIPFLVMNKIGIEHVDGEDSKKHTKAVPNLSFPANGDVAEACFTVKRQLELLQAENGILKKAIDDLRSEFAAGKQISPSGGYDSGKYREMERNGSKTSGGKKNSEKKSSEFNGYGGKGSEGDVSEELKKALMGATGA